MDPRGNKQGIELELPVELEKEACYVLYRRSGALTASAARGGEKEAVYDLLGYVSCRSKEQAYYYAGVLNYLAFCALAGSSSDTASFKSSCFVVETSPVPSLRAPPPCFLSLTAPHVVYNDLRYLDNGVPIVHNVEPQAGERH